MPADIAINNAKAFTAHAPKAKPRLRSKKNFII